MLFEGDPGNGKEPQTLLCFAETDENGLVQGASPLAILVDPLDMQHMGKHITLAMVTLFERDLYGFDLGRFNPKGEE